MTFATNSTTNYSPRQNSANRQQECTGKITQNNITTSVARAISVQKEQECTGKITSWGLMTPSVGRENSNGRNQELTEKITNLGGNLSYSPEKIQAPVKTSDHREISVSSLLSPTPVRLNSGQQQEIDRARQLIQAGINELSQKSMDEGLVKLERGIRAFSLVTTVHKELAEANLAAANAHEKKNALLEALICYKNAVDIYQKLETDPKLLNKFYKKIGLVLEGLGNADAAIQYYQKVAKFYESEQRTTTLTTTDFLDLATIYDKIAILLEAQHKPQEEVLPFHFKRAAIYERTKPNSIALASCYDKIGFLVRNREFYQKSLIIEEGLPKEEKDQFFSRVRMMYDAQRQTRECNSNFVNANKEARSSDVFSCATSYLFMAKVNEAYSQMKTAIKNYESILTEKCKISPKSSFLAASYENIGDAHLSGKKHDSAVPFYVRSLDIYSQILPEVDPILVSLRQKASGVITTVKENPGSRNALSMSQGRDCSVVRAPSVVPTDDMGTLIINLNGYSSGRLMKIKEKDEAAEKLSKLIVEYRDSSDKEKRYKEVSTYCNNEVDKLNNSIFDGARSSNLFALFREAVRLFPKV